MPNNSNAQQSHTTRVGLRALAKEPRYLYPAFYPVPYLGTIQMVKL